MRFQLYKLPALFFISLFLLLSGVTVEVSAQPETAAAKEAAALEVEQDTAESRVFAYSPMGRRDPFKALVQEKPIISGKVNMRPDSIKGPLEKFELSQYRLMAIMVVKGVPRAMIKAPDGKSYTVKVGQYIGMNDGIVKNIETKIVTVNESGLRVEKSPDRIVIEEAGVDSFTGKVVKENRYIVM